MKLAQAMKKESESREVQREKNMQQDLVKNKQVIGKIHEQKVTTN